MVKGSDPDHSIGERRYVTFGRSVKNRLLVVAHIEDTNSSLRAGCNGCPFEQLIRGLLLTKISHKSHLDSDKPIVKRKYQ
jgi:hypothetical protein